MNLPAILSLLCLGGATVAQTVQISNQGKSDYIIVTPDNPAPVVKTAAAELASHLKDVTGNTFAIVAEAARPAGKPAFIVGPVKASAAVFKDPTFANAKPDEIAIIFNGNDIYLNGQMPRGPLYAVYTHLMLVPPNLRESVASKSRELQGKGSGVIQHPHPSLGSHQTSIFLI